MGKRASQSKVKCKIWYTNTNFVKSRCLVPGSAASYTVSIWDARPMGESEQPTPFKLPPSGFGPSSYSQDPKYAMTLTSKGCDQSIITTVYCDDNGNLSS